ncbi:chromosome partitioning protein ParB [Rhodobacteraceae bacterium]|nr:chromosome partitioning protein ParB [Paracoccaceae bacterium]
MAKRKRLTPPRADFLQDAPSPAEIDPQDAAAFADTEIPADLETKAMFPMGVARTVTHRPPIAQVAGESADRAALEELSAMIAEARRSGRMVEALALDQIDAEHLMRDRMTSDDEDMAALLSSLRTRGQQAPVEVIDHGAHVQPRYGLISGWRRLGALRQLAHEAGTPLSDAVILAVIRQPKTASEAYVAMVEENEIRADISFYERARIVLRALEAGVYPDAKQALQSLFGNVSRAKRSKIKSFMTIVEQLDGALRFPAAISERSGLDLVKRLEADSDLAAFLRQKLNEADPVVPAAEAAILTAVPRHNTPPAPSAPKDTPEYDFSYDPASRTIRVSGGIVDDRLARDLQRWLDRRGG